MDTHDDRGQRLDRSSPMPLWAQLHADLVERLNTGEFVDEFPSEQTLTASYGVSRHTVREALRQLRADKILIAERGRPTRIAASSVIQQPLGALYSLFAAVEATGLSQHSIVQALEIRRDAAVSATLELPADAPLVYLERLRMAGDVPLAWDAAWLPATIAEPLLRTDFSHTALYIELDTQCGIRLTGGFEEITAVAPEPEQAALLGLDATAPALAIRRLGCLDNRPIELRNTVIRADRFTVNARFSPSEGYTFTPASTLTEK
ncbi:MAG: GntR family transcriptional regulator [Mycobacterium sp.]|jgi:GntR family transcriptional regulator|nr:MAG: GntR family transcriptional regulator [Mycobacterium sp.]